MVPIGQIYKWILTGLAIFSGLLLVFLVVVIGGEAILRLFNTSLMRGSVEFSEYALFSLAVLSAPWLLYHDGHLRVTVILDHLPARIKLWVVLVTDLIGLAACAIVFRYAVEVFVHSYTGGQFLFNDVVIRDWLLQWQVPLALGLLVIEFLRRIWFSAIAPEGRAALLGTTDHA